MKIKRDPKVNPVEEDALVRRELAESAENAEARANPVKRGYKETPKTGRPRTLHKK